MEEQIKGITKILSFILKQSDLGKIYKCQPEQLPFLYFANVSTNILKCHLQSKNLNFRANLYTSIINYFSIKTGIIMVAILVYHLTFHCLTFLYSNLWRLRSLVGNYYLRNSCELSLLQIHFILQNWLKPVEREVLLSTTTTTWMVIVFVECFHENSFTVVYLI